MKNVTPNVQGLRNSFKSKINRSAQRCIQDKRYGTQMTTNSNCPNWQHHMAYVLAQPASILLECYLLANYRF